jgi:antagonist of KipI
MSIKIIRPGLMTTLVSDGREGFRSSGIGPGGAMDYFAMKTANFLVGNDGDAVLEVGYSSAELFFKEDSLISVTGRGFEVFVNDKTAALWRPLKIKKESTLNLKKKTGGAWAYLAVHGGWKAQEWLNSFTTNLHAKAGGLEGRILEKGDVVEKNEGSTIVNDAGALPWGISSKELDEVYAEANVMRCTCSPESDLMSSASKRKFETREFAVSSQSNRMGYRLTGEALSLQEKIELVSSPVDFGTVQLLPDGNLIVLMADHQTTGGYPRIASVIRADLAKLSQLMPGEKVNFKMISFGEAEAELISRHQKLDELRKSCHVRIEKYFKNEH